MARYRKIDTRIWNDRKFRELDDKSKLAFFLVLTHPDTNQLGMLRSRSAALAMELGWHPDAMSDAILTLCRMGMLMVDDKAGFIFIPNFLKYNPPNGPNAVKGWSGLIDLMPECDLLSRALIHLKPTIFGLSEGVRSAIPDDIKDAISHAIQDEIKDAKEMPSRIQEQEEEQDISITSNDVIVETAVSDPSASEPEKVEKPKTGIDCPYQKIIADYNEILGPYLGMCQKLTPTRQKAVQARWRDCMKDGDFKTQDEGIAYFKRYFEYIKTCDFLMGNNGRDWRADFDWIFKQQNYTKICEGKYLSR
ncbi:hypothetical protein M3080_08880 [Parasutterella secunda]|uniref:hypothetical protein n=1 Tax=Parasutterella secunda TaxID=626947 RepID=UPI0020128BDC|nr:hypothetical protein [Parasutterella secunda]MCL1597472.1 hypothetical protein [Parasutterella secunda]